MTTQRRVFFGGLFAFSNAAAAEVISRFSECMAPPQQAPFTVYNESSKTFSFVCDHTESTPVLVFQNMLREYVEREQSRLLLRDQDFVVGSPKIQPLEGTVIQDSYSLNDSETEKQRQLINDLGGEESESDEDGAATVSKPDGMFSITQYWKPQSGNIDILTTAIAQEIAQSTGASLDPERGRGRVKIYGGNFNDALYKLMNLEKLMECLASQRLAGSPKASDNILLLREDDKESTVEFVRLTHGHRGFWRILVEESSRGNLDRKCIGELRKRLVYNGAPTAPINLSEFTATAEIRGTKVWADFEYPTIGQESVLQPLVEPTETKLDVTASTQEAPASPSRYLSVNENRVITQWTEDVTEPIDPELAPEPPNEDLVSKPGRRRRVANSDDEDSDESERVGLRRNVAPIQTTIVYDQLIVGDSESGGSVAANARPNARKRVVAVESNDSDGEIVDEVAVTGTRATIMTTTTRSLLSKPNPTPSVNKAIEEIRRIQTAAAHETLSPLVDIEAVEVTAEDGEENQVWFEGAITTLPLSATSVGLKAVPAAVLREPQLSPPPPPSFPSPADFDPNKYGTLVRGTKSDGGQRAQVPRGGRLQEGGPQAPDPASRASDQGRRARHNDDRARGRGRGQGRGGVANAISHALQDHASAVPLTADQNSARGQSRLAACRGQGYNGQPQSRRDTLIEIPSPPRQAQPSMPPPGWNIRLPEIPSQPTSPGPFNIIDDPIENIRRPSLQPISPVKGPAATDLSRRSGSTRSSGGGGALYVNTRNPGLNIGGLQDDNLAQLRRRQERERNQQQRQHSDEASTRTFHKTMGQQAPNPGPKGKQPQKQESKQERQARLAKAKSEAYAELKPAKGQQSVDPPISVDESKSLKKALHAVKSSQMSPEVKIRNRQTDDLITALKPLFEAGRAFPGRLDFEVQFGQALMPLGTAEGGKQYTFKGWNNLFHPAHGLPPLVASFTKILTTNGADIDRLLETKAMPGKGPSKLWNRVAPGPANVTYEFHCQSKENEEFWLIVDQDGTYHIRTAKERVGMVNLHYPGQVWDACAVIQGTLNWHNPSSQLITTAAAFVNSLYVSPSRRAIAITYRLPTKNDMTVRDLVMKRVSLHRCLLDGRQDFQLKTTEVKTLYHRFNQKDRKLGQGFEKDFNTMVQEGRLHYEVAVVHTGINTGLSNSQNLRLGDLTDEKTTGMKLLDHDKIKDLLELVSLTVAKMDWMGAHNEGTLPRLEAEQARREQSLGVITSHVGGNRVPASRITAGVRMEKLVPGVRANTTATLFEQDGKMYQYGLGGARVPLPVGLFGGVLDAIGEDDVLPDDSASVAAVPRQNQGARYPPQHQGTRVDPRTKDSAFW